MFEIINARPTANVQGVFSKSNDSRGPERESVTRSGFASQADAE